MRGPKSLRDFSTEEGASSAHRTQPRTADKVPLDFGNTAISVEAVDGASSQRLGDESRWISDGTYVATGRLTFQRSRKSPA